MGKAKKTRKFAVAKRVLAKSDSRLRRNQEREAKKEAERQGKKVTKVRQVPTGMFFSFNESLGPPYHVLVDTNFINFSIKNKLDLYASMMDCLLAKATPCITDCVMGELEKLGGKYRVALRMAKDPRFMRITCMCKGTYADDCLVQMAQQHRCYIIATCDKELKQRIRKIPGVPIMYISNRRFTIERMPEAFGAPR